MVKHAKSDGPWRLECILKRGSFCRACGSTKHFEMDHIWPKGQGGPSVVENGLALCGAWGDCQAHALKTAGSIQIHREWLDDDQIEWLEQVGWVAWAPADGAVTGRGWRHFAPIDPATGITRPPREGETLIQGRSIDTIMIDTTTATATQEEPPMAPDDEGTDFPTDEDGFADPALAAVPDPDDDDDGTLPEDDLAGAAGDALDEVGEVTQDHLEGTDYAKTKFVGMAYESPERPGLKDEVQYVIRGTCVGHEEQVMADGDIRQVAKIKVTSVERTFD